MKKLALLLVVFATLTSAIAQTKIGDATLPNKLTFDSQELVLNGAGLREKFWFDLYAGGLYLSAKESNASKIIKADSPAAIRLDVLSGLLSKKKLIGALRDGFEKTNSAASLKKVQPKIEKFIGFVVDDINVGDVYDIVYTPEKGITLFVNNANKGTIEGIDFKIALFNIWLAPTPVDEGLKSEMLGN